MNDMRPIRLDMETSARINEKIASLARKGVTSAAIARYLCISQTMVRSRVSRMRASGKIPSVAECRGVTPQINWKKYGKRIGSCREFVDMLTPDQMARLIAEVPDGLSIMQYVAAIVRDALEE